MYVIKNTIYFLMIIFHVHIIANSLEELKNYFINELTTFSKKHDTEYPHYIDDDWIIKVISGHRDIPSKIFNDLIKDPKLYKKIVEKISHQSIALFLCIKKEIAIDLAQLSIASQNEIETSLDTLYHFLNSQDCDIIKYPQREIIKQTFKTIERLVPSNQKAISQIKNLFATVEFAYRELRKPIEIINQIKAIDYLTSLNLKTRKDFTVFHIIHLNTILLKDIYENAGTWRKGSCKVQGYTSKNPDPIEIPKLINQLITLINTSPQTDILKFTADCHIKFLEIHPFIDGNKRTALLLLNLFLQLESYPPFIISGGHKDYLDYYYALDQAIIRNNSSAIQRMIVNQIEQNNLEKMNLATCKKIGIYSGTFDPPHLDHDNVIREALKKENLDYIIMIAHCNEAKPFKTNLPQRRHMINQVYQKEQKIIVTYHDRDAIINTIRKINPAVKIYGIFGSDVAAFYHNNNKIPYDADSWIINIRDNGHGMRDTLFLDKPTSYINFLTKYSSTEIKKQLKQKNINWQELPLAPKTINYIKENNLYTINKIHN